MLEQVSLFQQSGEDHAETSPKTSRSPAVMQPQTQAAFSFFAKVQQAWLCAK